MPALARVWSITEAGDPLVKLRPDEQIRDVEAFVCAIVERSPTARELLPADQQLIRDALLERVVVLTRKYDRRRDDPRRREPLAFDKWLYQQLRWDVITALREWFGRHGQKAVADTRAVTAGLGFDHGDDPVDSAAQAHPADGDPADNTGALPGSWTDTGADRRAGRQEPGMGVREGREAAA